MITNESDNAKLSTEQLIALDKFEKMAVNLKNQININQSNIQSLVKTNAQLEKDRENLTKTKEVLEKSVSELQQKVTVLETHIQESQKIVENARQEAEKLGNVHNAVRADLTQQAKDLAKLQEEIQTDRESLSKTRSIVEKDSAEVARKKVVLSETLKSL